MGEYIKKGSWDKYVKSSSGKGRARAKVNVEAYLVCPGIASVEATEARGQGAGG